MIQRRFFLQGALAALVLPALRAHATGELRPVDLGPALDFKPLDAKGLKLIQKAYPFSGAQRAALQRNGFVFLDNRAVPSFGTAYEQLYYNDLPLFVSADSMLHALHRSFDDILKKLELEDLIARLETVLVSMRRDLGTGELRGLAAETVEHIDLYLAVALSLLNNRPAAPIAGAENQKIEALVQGARSAAGMKTVTLFGAPRPIDFSQFKPRGHYTDHPRLESYFRAMMWLGRIDLRLIEETEAGPIFRRAQFDAAVGMRLLMDQPTHEAWLALDQTIGAFVGPYDSIDPRLLDELMADLSISRAADVAQVSDANAQAALKRLPGGEQRILSHIVSNDSGGETLPLSRTFLLLGQRYTVDSHAMSDLVYDRVGNGQIPRMMPDPLDVAYTVFGNDRALPLLAGELRRFGYDADLARVRARIDARQSWETTLYDAWLYAIRTLSTEQAAREQLPTVARTEAWGRRVLNTQLASWAELRHDTILYAKQSYTSAISCEHPDAYVDPYPAFYAALVQYARVGQTIIENLDPKPELKSIILAHFNKLSEVSEKLGEIARRQRDGERISNQHLAFINEVVRSRYVGCGELAGAEGWYPELFLDSIRSVEYDPTIADVHTQPTDRSGAVVGRILHVGTSMPKLAVVTVNTCDGPRAYVGVVSAYHEVITEDFDRLDDNRWDSLCQKADIEPWIADLGA